MRDLLLKAEAAVLARPEAEGMAGSESDAQDPSFAAPSPPGRVGAVARRLAGTAARAARGILIFIGAAAVLVALGIGLLSAALHVDDERVSRAIDHLSAAARALPGVHSAHATAGAGDLGTRPTDLYGDVTLGSTCSLSTQWTTATRLRAIMAREQTFRWHPTLWCRARGLTVSPIASVTAERFAAVRLLAQDQALRAAAVVSRQRDDDPSPDIDNDAVQVDLYVRSRTSGSTARAWLRRLQPDFPSATFTATNGTPGGYLDALALNNDQWTVIVQAGDPQRASMLRTAEQVERSLSVSAAFCDGRRGEVTLITSNWSVLQSIERALPAPTTSRTQLRFTATLRSTT